MLKIDRYKNAQIWSPNSKQNFTQKLPISAIHNKEVLKIEYNDIHDENERKTP